MKPYRSLVRATEPAIEPVTLAEAKAHLRVDISDDDALISAIIKSAREFCEEYLDRSLVYTQWTMRMDAIPWEIVLPRPPVAQAGTTTATVVTYTLETQATATLDTSTYRVDRTATPGEQAARPLLNEQDQKNEDQDLGQHCARKWFHELVGDPERESRNKRAPEVSDAAEHHDHEAVYDVGLTEVRRHVVDLRQRDARQSRKSRA